MKYNEMYGFNLVRVFFLLIGSLFLLGCHSKQEKSQIGPLNKINEFEVLVFFSPFETFDRTLLFKALVDNLKEMGNVEILNRSILSAQSTTSPVLFFSLGGYHEENKGSLDVIASVEVEANHFKIASSIWKTEFMENTETACYPVMENGLIVFKRNPEKSQETTISKNEPAAVIRQIVASFAEEYHKSNPESEKPLFRVYTPEQNFTEGSPN